MDDPADLELIPRSVRDKLDRIRIKLHLEEWGKLSLAERRRLCDEPCSTRVEAENYRSCLVRMVRGRTGRDPTPLPMP
jgi:hypothetical protein